MMTSEYISGVIKWHRFEKSRDLCGFFQYMDFDSVTALC